MRNRSNSVVHAGAAVVNNTIKKILLIVVSALLPAMSNATTYTVNSTAATTAGSGTSGTLPYCVAMVNAGAGGDVINFSVTGTIAITSGLTLGKAVTIDGTTAPSYAGVPRVQVANGGGVTWGFTLSANGCVIKGLSVTGFTGGFFTTSGGNTISLCYIGLTPAGTAAGGVDGIYIYSGTGNTIGGVGAGNVISGNTGFAMEIYTSGNTIQGNTLGLNVAGTAAIANGSGILLAPAASNTVIGGTTAGAGNIISGNTNYAIIVHSTGNTIQGNTIGLNAAGTAAVPNNGGITIFGTGSNNFIGGATAGAGNIISGNSGNGITIQSTGNSVKGNIIGMNAAGTLALGNNSGAVLQNSSNTVGGSTAGERNYISGNRNDGVDILASGNIVKGNYIGINKAGTAAVANAYQGIWMDNNASNNQVGGTASGEGNVISGNTSVGLWINSGTGNTVQGNIVGMDAAGTFAIRNSYGIYILGGANTVGGSASGAGNYISGNSVGLYIASNGSTAKGNFIGLNTAGTAAVPNTTYGLNIDNNGSNNQIGGTGAGEGNVISGNSNTGIWLGSGTGNTIQGNTIGLNAAGTIIPNGKGIVVNTSAGNTTIGGTTTAARNIISGNTNEGITINSTGNTIQGNYIGVNAAGSVARPNRVGILLNPSGNNNIVGGTAAGACNVISGNAFEAIAINGTGNTIQGNTIGLSADGTTSIPNRTGMLLNSTANNTTIGGTIAGAGNILSGHTTMVGIIMHSSGNTVQGNTFGLNAAGTAARPNKVGIFIGATGSNNIIGGTAAGAGNVMCGNTTDAIQVYGIGNTIQGNTIGLNAAGTTAIANGSGISLMAGADNNTIGGTAAGAGNVISGNTGAAITINSTGNIVKGNIAGMNAAGTAAVPNNVGIALRNTSNTVGGSAAGDRNYLSGNINDGLQIFANGNTAKGNYIGLNKAGTAAIPNQRQGIWMNFNASNNQIGGTAAGEGNVISGNVGVGIWINTGTGNTVQGNLIGLNAAGTAALPNEYGIYIPAGANTIGGSTAGAGNYVSGNQFGGIYITSSGSSIKGNFVGLNIAGTSAIANLGGGVIIENGSNNQVGGTSAGEGNTISGNTANGVIIVSGTGNAVRGNSIYDNDGLGIDLNNDMVTRNDVHDTDSGPNNLINFPIITSLVQAGGNTTISGTYDGAASATFSLDLFSNTVIDPSGHGEGKTYIGSISVSTDGDGHGIFSAVIAGTYSIVSATATDVSNNTSEFSGTGPAFVTMNPSFTICQDAAALSIVSLLHATDGMLGQTLTWSQSVAPSHGTLAFSSATAISGAADIAPGGSITYTPATGYSGTDTFTVQVSDGIATATAVITVTVNPLPVVSAGNSVPAICQGGTTTALDGSFGGGATSGTWSDGGAGGTFTGNDGTLVGAANATYTASSSSATSVTLTFTTAGGFCGTVAADKSLTVNPNPVINAIGSNTPVCAGQMLDLNSTAGGGTGTLIYSWTGPNSFASSSEDPSIAATTDANGVYTLTVSDDNNCADTAATALITVYPVQSIIGDTTVLFGQTITLSNAVTGGSWGTATPWTTAVTPVNGNVKGVSAGTSIVSYTTANGCVSTHTVTVLSGTNACVGQTIVISDALSGGTWTSSNAGIATVTLTAGQVKGVTAGKAVITHRTSTSMITTTVTVNPLAATTAAPASVCQGQALTVTNTTAGGGTWYSGNTTTAVVTSAGLVGGLLPGTVTMYYTPVAGCATTKLITVNAVTPIIGVVPVCVGQTITVSNSTAGGAWSTSTNSLASISSTGVVKGISAGTPRISYIWPNGCQTTQTITVNALSGITGGTPAMCSGSSITLINATPFGGVWSSSNSSAATVNPATGVVRGAGAGMTTISFTTTVAGCVATRTITVNACREAAPGEEPSVDDVTATSFEVRLFPNPNNGTFTLNGTVGGNDDELAIDVLNVVGQIIYTGKVKPEHGTINSNIALGNTLVSGTYLLRLHSGGGDKVFHFVVAQ